MTISMHPSLRLSFRFLSLVPVLLMTVQPGLAQEKEMPKEAPAAVRLSPEQIPATPELLPVLRLFAQKPPMGFVQEALRKADPEAKKLAPLSGIPEVFRKGERPPEEIVGTMSEGHLAAYVDLKTGDAKIFASFMRQKPIPEEREGAQMERTEGLAREIFGRPDILEKDATQVSFERPRVLFGYCGRQNDRIYDTTALPPANCLINFWQPNLENFTRRDQAHAPIW